MTNKNLWHNLPKPFTILAPMDGVTDFAFRQNIAKIGRPDVFFTEFTSVEGLQSDGKKHLDKRLFFQNNEQPVVAQIWGIKPENFYKSAKLITGLNFSGIDINMGCPDRAVVKSGCCSALIKNHKKTKEIINAVKEGAGTLPVSVKTRLGFSKINEMREWLGFLLRQKLAALTVHLRAVTELSLVPAHWEIMPEIIKLRNKISPDTILIGNGDLKSLDEIQQKYRKDGCEGFMIGRGVLSNPWIFNKSISYKQITIKEKFEAYLEHIKFFEDHWGDGKNFATLKKFCKAYLNNFSNASGIREELMLTKSLNELKTKVKELSNTV